MPHRFPGWESLSSALLADVLDTLGHRHSALPSALRPLIPSHKICGPAATLACMPVAADPAHPYAAEMECIDALKPGQILVIATGQNDSCALWGELLSTSARARGALGVVTDGLTRDAAHILDMGFPVWAAGFSPLDSRGRLDGVAVGVPLRFGPCIVRHSDWIFADIDGVVCVPSEVADEAFRRALEKASGENRVRAELTRGRPLKEVFAEFGIL